MDNRLHLLLSENDNYGFSNPISSRSPAGYYKSEPGYRSSASYEHNDRYDDQF